MENQNDLSQKIIKSLVKKQTVTSGRVVASHRYSVVSVKYEKRVQLGFDF